MSLEHVEKEKSKLPIHWLPARYNEAAVEVVVTALTGDCQPEVYRLRNQEGKWDASCRPTRPIPHYAAVKVPGLREKWHNIKITMPDRLTMSLLLRDQSLVQQVPQQTLEDKMPFGH